RRPRARLVPPELPRLKMRSTSADSPESQPNPSRVLAQIAHTLSSPATALLSMQPAGVTKNWGVIRGAVQVRRVVPALRNRNKRPTAGSGWNSGPQLPPLPPLFPPEQAPQLVTKPLVSMQDLPQLELFSQNSLQEPSLRQVPLSPQVV